MSLRSTASVAQNLGEYSKKLPSPLNCDPNLKKSWPLDRGVLIPIDLKHPRHFYIDLQLAKTCEYTYFLAGQQPLQSNNQPNGQTLRSKH